MKLEKFSKNKRNKKVVLGSILGILIVLGSITLYKTFALYKEEKTFNVLRGRVPSFVSGDLELAITMDGESINTLPSKGAYDVSITCDKGAKGYWDYERWGPYLQNIKETKTKCTIQFKRGKYFSEYIKDLSDTSNHVVKVSHEATEQTPALEDYRYVGSNEEVNNYVYFGCSENCTDDNLYRIIGVIPTQKSMDGEYENRVKLIKASNYTETSSGFLKNSSSATNGVGYSWNHNSTVKWEESTLQRNVLNDVYWNSFGEYKNYVEDTLWYLGSITYGSYENYSPNQFYQIERSSTKGVNKGMLQFLGKIGLMYPSDYGYSLGTNYFDLSIKSYTGNYLSGSWLYNLENKYDEWVITQESSGINGGYYVVSISSTGEVIMAHSTVGKGVRPVFYLKANIKYKSGDGSRENPYRIDM